MPVGVDDFESIFHLSSPPLQVDFNLQTSIYRLNRSNWRWRQAHSESVALAM
jgi:hypothetical protein